MRFDLRRRDLKGFHPRKIPSTKALADQKQLSMSELESFFFCELPNNLDWKEDFATVSATELLRRAKEYSPELERTLSPTKLGRFLNKHGAAKQHGKYGSVWTRRRSAICAQGAKLYGIDYHGVAEVSRVVPFSRRSRAF